MEKGKKKRSPKKKGATAPRKSLSTIEKETVIQKLQTITGPLCEGENLTLVKVDYLQEGYDRVIRIYIDKPGGVTISDCSNISMQLGDLLDVELDIDTSYRLEVSSPGI